MQGTFLHTIWHSRLLKAHHIYQVMTAGLIVVWLCWCTGASTPQALAAGNTSYVRIIHASPYVGTADIFVDGQPFLNSFAFGSVTQYAPLPEGPHKVQIALVGKGIGASALTKTLPVEAGKAYTIAAIGATPDTLNLQVFVDDNQVIADHTKVRIYHLIPDAGNIHVLLGGDTPLNAMSYQDDSNYVTMNSGNCSIQITSASMNQTLSNIEKLSPNSIASIFAIGMFHGSPQARLIFTQIQGIPGAPQTGSDPVLGDSTQPVSTFWPGILIALLIVSIGGTGIFRYYHRSRTTL